MFTLLFPHLVEYIETSPPTEDYNCIAWAFRDNTKWWWPNEGTFWPTGIRCDETIEAFDELFSSGGAFVAANEDVEIGVIKIALFALNGKPTHAARQLQNGQWTSKMGKGEDIAHPLRHLEHGYYGIVSRIYAIRVPI